MDRPRAGTDETKIADGATDRRRRRVPVTTSSRLVATAPSRGGRRPQNVGAADGIIDGRAGGARRGTRGRGGGGGSEADLPPPPPPPTTPRRTLRRELKVDPTGAAKKPAPTTPQARARARSRSRSRSGSRSGSRSRNRRNATGSSGAVSASVARMLVARKKQQSIEDRSVVAVATATATKTATAAKKQWTGGLASGDAVPPPPLPPPLPTGPKQNDEKIERLPLVFPACRRVVAIGDVHGDLRFLKRCLRLAGLIDGRDRWCGGDTVAVQTGDQLDRARDLEEEDDATPVEDDSDDEDRDSEASDAEDEAERKRKKKAAGKHQKKRAGDDADDDDDMEVMRYLDELDAQAQRASGRVFSLLGNHEIFNCLGHMRYVSYESLASFGYDVERRKTEFRPGGSEARRMARTRRVALIIGNVLFTHAGFETRSMRRFGVSNRASLEAINNAAQDYLNGIECDPASSASSSRKTRLVGRLDGDQIERVLSGRVLGQLEADRTRKPRAAKTATPGSRGGRGGGERGGGDGDGAADGGDDVAVVMSDVDIARKPKFNKRCQPLLEAMFEALDIRACVIGHTVQENGVSTACGRVARIDIGGSQAFRKFDANPSVPLVAQVIEILDNTRMRILTEKTPPSWAAAAAFAPSSVGSRR